MATNEINLKDGERAQRKQLITVAEWTESGSATPVREILGVRTEDSSIELNLDIETSTDILGHTYTDVNKTEPQQDLDTFYIRKESKLADYLDEAVRTNNIQAYNGKFTMYIISAYRGSEGAYSAVKHINCSIFPQSIGGSSYVNMPLQINYSNNLTDGTVDKLGDDFVFTPSGGVSTQSQAQTLNIKKATVSTT